MKNALYKLSDSFVVVGKEHNKNLHVIVDVVFSHVENSYSYKMLDMSGNVSWRTEAMLSLQLQIGAYQKA